MKTLAFGIVSTALILLSVGASAQNGCTRVIQNGIVKTGSPVVWIAPCTIQQAGGSAGSRLSGGPPMITDLGVMGPFGILDAPTTGPYHQALLGWSGSTLNFDIEARGGAPSAAFTIELNGVTYQFPFTTSGAVGPNSTAINELAVWNNTVGTLLRQHAPAQITDSQSAAITADGASLAEYSQSGLSANTIYRMTTSALVTSYDIDRSVGSIPSGSTATGVMQYGAYQVNNNAAGSGATAGNGVLYFGIGVAATNGAAEWGINTVLTDNTTPNVSAGTGRILNNEFDFNVTSPNTVVEGLFLTGASLSQPTLANGFTCNSLGPSVVWTNCFSTAPGAATNFATIGFATAASGNNLPSQYIAFTGTNGSGSAIGYKERINANQVFEYSGVLSAPVWQFDGAVVIEDSSTNVNGVEIGAQGGAAPSVSSQTLLLHYYDASSVSQFYSLETVSNSLFFQSTSGSGKFVFNGTISAPSLGTQAHVSGNACLGFNASTGQIYISTTVTTC